MQTDKVLLYNLRIREIVDAPLPPKKKPLRSIGGGTSANNALFSSEGVCSSDPDVACNFKSQTGQASLNSVS